MKVVIYTIDLFPGREYLMPWRTILEVARGMIVNGHHVIVLNGCNNIEDINNYMWHEVSIISFSAGWTNLAERLLDMNIDALFVPVTWRTGLRNIGILKRVDCKKVAYLSGGVYDFGSGFMLMRESSLEVAKPYLIECLIPKWLLGIRLREAEFKATIGLNHYTASVAAKAGLPNSLCIYPGIDSFAGIHPNDNIIEKYNLNSKKWMLFTGSPATVRGASVLVNAVDRTSENIHLVMLMRSDKGTDMDRLNRQFQSMKHRERITVISEKLSREQLRAFFGAAWYGVLPFLAIPSEVPLTYFELLCCGTPVVSFPNGGTTEYLKDALVISKRSIEGLARTLDLIWRDEMQRQQKSEEGIKLMATHPSWDEVASKWEEVIQ